MIDELGEVVGYEWKTHPTHVASRNDSGSSNESGTDVSNDVSVKVRSNDDVELLGVGDELHGAVDRQKARVRGEGKREGQSLDEHKKEETRKEREEGERDGDTNVLSTIIWSNLIPAASYSLATSAQVRRKRPSPSFMMLALWTQVTFYSRRKE